MDNLAEIVVAALLHDVGKFSERSGGESEPGLNEKYRPKTKRGYSHAHVIYTYPFILKHLELPTELNEKKETIAHLASCHHKPDKKRLDEMSLRRGDCLSSGHDRIPENKKRAGNHISKRMLSTFYQVALRKRIEEKPIKEQPCYTLHCIDEQRPFAGSYAEWRKARYEPLFNNYMAGLKGLPCHMGVAHYISSIVSLQEKYMWCIPSATYGTVPDISLHDHALTTAAIAQALYLYHKDQQGIPGDDRDVKKFILFGGDLSGIQDYIFGLEKSHSAGVAKIFRARSLYLQVIMRSVTIALLDRLKLYSVARIIDAGGRFVLLLPATNGMHDQLTAFEKEVQEWFFSNFRGEVTLICSYSTELSENELIMGSFQNRLDDFLDSIEEGKTRKFDKILGEKHPVMELDYKRYENGSCNVCNKEPADPVSMKNFMEEFNTEIKICKGCHHQISFVGKKITDPSISYIVFSRDSKNTSEELSLFDGITMRFTRHISSADATALEIDGIRERSIYGFHPIAGHLPVIGKDDMRRWETNGFLIEEDGIKRYDGDIVKAGMPKTFQILADESREETENEDGSKSITGKPLLAALKADVDNLGIIFSIGFGDQLSVSRFVGLSRMINFFFGEYLVQIIKDEFPDIYVIFSGGDDLFVLGPWPRVLKFAVFVREAFAGFVSGNKDISLSAGIAVVKPTLPVHSIAREADRLLDLSKAHVSETVSKDSVTVFDTTVSWEDFGQLMQEGDWFVDMIRGKKVSIGMVRRLLEHSNDFLAFTKRGDIRRGIYQSHMTYDFARNLNNKVLSEDELAKFMGIKQDHFLLEHMKLPVTIALYKTRS